MTLTITVLLGIGAIYCFAHRGRDWPSAIIFTCLGVFAADTVIGDAARWLVTGIKQAAQSIGG